MSALEPRVMVVCCPDLGASEPEPAAVPRSDLATVPRPDLDAAQRFDPATGRTSGAPMDVSHFHSSRLSMSSLPLARLGICVARDKLILNLVEVTGGIWSLIERPQPNLPTRN